VDAKGFDPVQKWLGGSARCKGRPVEDCYERENLGGWGLKYPNVTSGAIAVTGIVR